MLPLLFGNGAYVRERNDPFVQLLWHPRNVWCAQHQPHDLTNTNPLSSYCTLMKHNTNAIHNMTSASQEEKKREGGKILKRRIHSCTRERERGSSLISYFPALACPHKQLSPPSQVKTEVHRDPDYQEPAELIGKQTSRLRVTRTRLSPGCAKMNHPVSLWDLSKGRQFEPKVSFTF